MDALRKDLARAVRGYQKTSKTALAAKDALHATIARLVDEAAAVLTEAAVDAEAFTTACSGGTGLLAIVRSLYDLGEDRNRSKALKLADVMLEAVQEARRANPGSADAYQAIQAKISDCFLRSCMRLLVPYSTGRASTGELQAIAGTLVSQLFSGAKDAGAAMAVSGRHADV